MKRVTIHCDLCSSEIPNAMDVNDLELEVRLNDFVFVKKSLHVCPTCSSREKIETFATAQVAAGFRQSEMHYPWQNPTAPGRV